MKAKRFNEAVLSNKDLREITYEYVLDFSGDNLIYYDAFQDRQNCMNASTQTVEKFIATIRRKMSQGDIHFVYFDGNKLFIKYQDCNYYKDVFTLTDNAKKNKTLMQFLSVLPNIQSDYEMLCREEKYTRPLVNLYYS